MKKVSVIVPVYNTQKYLDQCLNSLVNQTLDDIEIIVINDGSKDSSLEIIKRYMKEYPEKIILIDQKNCGISVARNNGIKAATSKYLGFVDSDDFIDLDMYEKLYNTIKKSNADIIVCNYKKYFTDSKNIKKINVVNNIKSSNIYNDPKMINNIDFGPCNKLFKRDLFKDIEFPINKKYEDLNTIMKVFFNAKKIDKLDEYLYFYRINEEGETLTINKKVNDILYILDDIIEYTKTINCYEDMKKELKKLCINKLFYYLIISYQLNDKEYINKFRKDIINFLNKHFKGWKKDFIFHADFKIITKLILTNNFIFKIYLARK